MLNDYTEAAVFFIFIDPSGTIWVVSIFWLPSTLFGVGNVVQQ